MTGRGVGDEASGTKCRVVRASPRASPVENNIRAGCPAKGDPRSREVTVCGCSVFGMRAEAEGPGRSVSGLDLEEVQQGKPFGVWFFRSIRRSQYLPRAALWGQQR